MVQDSMLCQLQEGQWAFVSGVTAEPAMARRLLELGLIPGTRVTCVGKSPAGDPAAYLIRGAVIALRRGDVAGISVCCTQGTQPQPAPSATALAV